MHFVHLSAICFIFSLISVVLHFLMRHKLYMIRSHLEGESARMRICGEYALLGVSCHGGSRLISHECRRSDGAARMQHK